MIQDIHPKKLNNEYIHKHAEKKSVIFSFLEDKVLCNSKNELSFPLFEDLADGKKECIFLFDIDGTDFFLARQGQIKASPEFAYESIDVFRAKKPKHLAFAGITAYHLYRWYRENEYCGSCGSPFLLHNTKERVLVCEKCENQIYPKIAPVVIVGVTDDDKLLMTRSATSTYKNYALIAGFVEIGESAEEAVRREVMEEVGVRVKDISYYKSQPWGFSGSLLLGYYAKLDGEATINIKSKELSKAKWIKRADIKNEDEDFSLTNEMICKFKNG